VRKAAAQGRVTREGAGLLRLAFVVQRYGLEIAGGAEFHCRLVAEHLARHARVEILTTCAADYITWANRYREGVEILNGIPVRRFKVKRPRDPERFADWTDRVFRARHEPADELRWLDEEGPFSPRLVRHLERHRTDHDYVIFFSYRYYTTYHGLWAVADRALLVPTAEDDGVYRLPIFPPLFRAPRAIVYNSVEEREMIHAASGNEHVPGDVVGVGSALPEGLDPAGFRARAGLPGPFMLYVGRIDENKGCRQLFEFFRRYRRETGSKLTLALVGAPVLAIPDDPGIVHLGFLPDDEKWNALAACDLLAMPSPLESLSMVTLEAWWAERPVLANGKCAVLRGQCRRANAGLYYSGYDEFREALALLEGDAGLRAALGRNGRAYFERHYAWDVIERKYLELLAGLRAEDARRAGAAQTLAPAAEPGR
jgi:glycosyltransferase involved in cell wall biosynthesis